MKQIFKVIVILISLNLYSQDIIEMKYESYVEVNAFNNFGSDEIPSSGEIGEFIFSPIEKKLTIYRRDISSPSTEFTMSEYAINNSVFLLHGTNYYVFGQNETDLFDNRGKLAGRIEYNPETKILVFISWDKKAVMKKIWITSIVVKPLKVKANSKEIPLGEADAIISRPDLDDIELFGRVNDFIKKFYNRPKITNIDSDKKIITIESSSYDVFNRKEFINRKPIVGAKYFITIRVEDSNVKVNFQHLEFLVNNLKYYINLEDVMSGNETPLLYKEDKIGYMDCFKRIINSLEYYIDNEEIIYYTARTYN